LALPRIEGASKDETGYAEVKQQARAASTIEKRTNKGDQLDVTFKDYITTFAKDDEFS
jgi:hypothetical protein